MREDSLSPSRSWLTALALAGIALTALVACGSRTDIDLVRGASSGPRGAPDGSAFPVDAGNTDATTRCGDGGPSAVAYVLDDVGNLYQYFPSTGQEVLLGTPNCGDSSIQWTMTAGRDHAYIVYTDWTMYSVDLTTLVCSPTPFVAGQLGLDDDFGVALTGSGSSERIYYYGIPSGSSTAILAVSDTVSFTLSMIGTVDPMMPNATLFGVNITSDNQGHLFAYAPEGYLLEIDPATAAVLLAVEAPVSNAPYATLAFEGSVYLFSSQVVSRYEPPLPNPISSLTVDAGAVGAGSYVICP